MESIGKMLLFLGGTLLLLGILFMLLGKLPGMGRLPGDILIHRGNFTFFFPLVTMLVVSLVLTILINVILRLCRG